MEQESDRMMAWKRDAAGTEQKQYRYALKQTINHAFRPYDRRP